MLRLEHIYLGSGTRERLFPSHLQVHNVRLGTATFPREGGGTQPWRHRTFPRPNQLLRAFLCYRNLKKYSRDCGKMSLLCNDWSSGRGSNATILPSLWGGQPGGVSAQCRLLGEAGEMNPNAIIASRASPRPVWVTESRGQAPRCTLRVA